MTVETCYCSLRQVKNVCESCVDKLAKKLMEHHKIDLIRAYELAEKAVERVEQRSEVRTVSKEEMVRLGFDPDYSKTCITATGPCSSAGKLCTYLSDCTNSNTVCNGGCPAALANSTYVSTDCVYKAKSFCVNCVGVPTKCGSTKKCDTTSGACYYNCNAGYVWNPDTLQCELLPVGIASKRLLVGVGL